MFIGSSFPVGRSTHHHACRDGYAPATVSVWYDIPVSHTQEGDGNEPHSVEQIGMLLIVISVAEDASARRTNELRRGRMGIGTIIIQQNYSYGCLVFRR